MVQNGKGKDKKEKQSSSYQVCQDPGCRNSKGKVSWKYDRDIKEGTSSDSCNVCGKKWPCFARTQSSNTQGRVDGAGANGQDLPFAAVPGVVLGPQLTEMLGRLQAWAGKQGPEVEKSFMQEVLPKPEPKAPEEPPDVALRQNLADQKRLNKELEEQNLAVVNLEERLEDAKAKSLATAAKVAELEKEASSLWAEVDKTAKKKEVVAPPPPPPAATMADVKPQQFFDWSKQAIGEYCKALGPDAGEQFKAGEQVVDAESKDG